MSAKPFNRRNTKRLHPDWTDQTELIGLALELQPDSDSTLYPQYTIGLHAWLLDQVRQFNPDLSAYLHDGESEKPFTLSGLQGLHPTSKARSATPSLYLQADQTYNWIITGLSQPVVRWLAQWLKQPPPIVELRGSPLHLKQWRVLYPPTTYDRLLPPVAPQGNAIVPSLSLSFLSPTSFRRKGHHFPLPVPRNLFHSYLRRWNDFSGQPIEQEPFLDWIDEFVIISRHHLESLKVVAGKKGSVTGFTGAIELTLARAALKHPQFVQQFSALGQLAPYCGTGHKTTFGLGQTALGWTTAIAAELPTLQTVLADRITLLTEQFQAQRKRTGGDRATEIAETWATILARRELGESLQSIAQDLDMPYETVKTYAKLARRSLRPLS